MAANPKKNTLKRAHDVIQQSTAKNLPLAIAESEQLKEVNSLKEIVRYEKFFFVVNSIELKLEHVHGVNKWLGYDEETFSLSNYFEIIPQECMEFLIHLAKITSDFANSKEFKPIFRQQQYVIDVALRHADGHYVLCKRGLSPWQWQENENGQVVTHYMNEFTVINSFVEEIPPEITPRFTDTEGNKLFEIEDLLRKNSKEAIENEKKMFSTQELRILRKFGYNPTITASEIAEAFKTKTSTIHTLSRRIITKGREKFHDERFSSVKELAQILRKNFWI